MPAWWTPIAAADEPGQRPAEPGGEAEAADRVGDRVALLARAQLGRQQRLRALQRRRLREVHDVDRRLVGCAPAPRAARAAAPATTRSAAAPGRSASSTSAVSRPVRRVRSSRSARDVAERRRHQQELRLRQARAAAPATPSRAAARRRSGTRPSRPGRRRRSAPSRSAMLASTSAVQQMIGAPALTDASPVSMPTFSAPNDLAQREELLADTSALIGAV